jgi:outer membrane protein assembly factor BamB
VYDDLAVVGIGGQKGSLVAYDLKSGDLRWSQGRAPASYSSPTVAVLAGARQIVWFRHGGLAGFDPKDGRELWSVVWNDGLGNNVCQPLVFSSNGKGEPDTVLISAGDDAGAAAYAIERSLDGFKARELWKNKNLKLKYSSAIQVRDMAVGLDEHILTAIDLKTGKRRWKHGDRFGYGQIVASGDQLIVQAEDGRIVLGEAIDKEFIERGKFQSKLEKTWNTPALVGNLLVLRNQQSLAAYQLPTE